MDQILKALNDALENKDFRISYLTEEIKKEQEKHFDIERENTALKKYIEELEEKLHKLQTENKSLKNDLDFYKPAKAAKEDF
jgi:cell shape-determining protein MreC